MTNRLFGTDGIRGRVGTELTADLAFRVGRAAAGYFLERGVGRAVLARDTRISGEMLAAAFLSGVTSAGVDAVDLGIAPTPAVSALISSAIDAQRSAPGKTFGVVISASHNPYEDNGIKLFAETGEKPAQALEDAIERRLLMTSELDASGRTVGRIGKDASMVNAYLADLRNRFPVRLKKTRLVIDAAHGAWAPHAQPLFAGIAGRVSVSDAPSAGSARVSDAGRVSWLNCDFDGTNINAGCGSTHIESLDSHLSDDSVGLAFDGDGDRMLIRIASSAFGHNPQFQTLDGDALLFLFAKHLVTFGPVIGTVMSNGALDAALRSMGRVFFRAAVGDREVYEMMVARDADLGGEQSGHIIFRDSLGAQRSALGDFSQRTGDGAATAMAFLKVFAESYGESIPAILADLPRPFPQKLVNIRVSEKIPWETDRQMSLAVASAREKLGPHGRLIIRYSGTEPLLRLMAESPDAAAVHDQLAFLEDRFRARAGKS